MKKTVLFLGLLLLAGSLMAQTRRTTGEDANGYLAPERTNERGGFSIRPPTGWWQSESSSKYYVKFIETSYEAYIIIDDVKLKAPVKVDADFIDFVGKQNSEVKRTLPAFTVVSNRPVRVNGVSSYRTEAIFQAGPNKALISIYYVPSGSRVFMIMTICPDTTARKWDPIFTASVQTFKATQ